MQNRQGEHKQTLRRLPKPVTRGEMSLEEAIIARRSVRSFMDEVLDLEQVGQLAFAAQGITDSKGGRFRAAPSAGGILPMDLDLVMPDGVFRYVPQGHALERRIEGDRRNDLAKASLGQASVANAPLVMVISATRAKMIPRYGERTDRYLAMEAGHIAQNVHLQAHTIGLGSVPVGAFDDAAVAEVLGLANGEEPLYIIPVGRPAK